MLIVSMRCQTQGKGEQEKHGSRGGEGAGEGFVDMDPKRANVTRRGCTTMWAKGVKMQREKESRYRNNWNVIGRLQNLQFVEHNLQVRSFNLSSTPEPDARVKVTPATVRHVGNK